MIIKLNIMGIYVHIHYIYFYYEKHIVCLRTKRKISESVLMKNPFRNCSWKRDAHS